MILSRGLIPLNDSGSFQAARNGPLVISPVLVVVSPTSESPVYQSCGPGATCFRPRWSFTSRFAERVETTAWKYSVRGQQAASQPQLVYRGTQEEERQRSIHVCMYKIEREGRRGAKKKKKKVVTSMTTSTLLSDHTNLGGRSTATATACTLRTNLSTLACSEKCLATVVALGRVVWFVRWSVPSLQSV